MSDADNDRPSQGNPPKKSRWQKGCPSPNPNGRPRKKPVVTQDARTLLEGIISKKIQVTQGDCTVVMDRLEMAFEQLVIAAAKGDRGALRDLIKYAQLLGIDLTGQLRRATESLAQNQQEVLDAYVARRQSSQINSERVLAPDDLTGDDLDEDE